MAPWCLCVAVLGLLSLVEGYPFYRDRMPNGHNVPHPCTPNVMWDGVGHFTQQGGGARNTFGDDFAIAGHMWTPELCAKDSDLDGVSNGAELGDPECVWKVGDTPAFINVTHPGICDPVGSEYCRTLPFPFSCEGEAKYECPAVESPEVKSMDLTFPVTTVPPLETNLFCKNFKVPVDQAVHAIAVEPIVDNVNVLHHILLFGCTAEVEINDPQTCGMTSRDCRILLSAWTLGVDGICLQDDVGVSLGPGSFEYVAIQVHWNNPLLTEGYQDGSGLRLFYTENLRPYDQQMAILGQNQLEIPALTQEVVAAGICPSECTQGIGHPINITSALIHMHYLGISSRLEVYRDGELAELLIGDGVYDYEAPVMYQFDPPIEIRPGDEIRTYCYYNSLDGLRRRETDTYFGQATNDEMCFSFLSYYPATPERFQCVQVGKINLGCNSDITDPDNCDVCGLYRLMMSTSEYLETTDACKTSCSEMCHEQMGVLLQSECALDVIQSIQNGATLPDEFSSIVQAFITCLPGAGDHLQKEEPHMPWHPRPYTTDLPSLEECGINVENGTPWMGPLGLMVYFLVACLARLAWL